MTIKAVIETLIFFVWIAQALVWETQALVHRKCFERKHQQLQWKHARLDLLTRCQWVASITLQHSEPHCTTFAWRKNERLHWQQKHAGESAYSMPRQQTATDCDTLQQTATDCNTLQQTATDCDTLRHTIHQDGDHTYMRRSCLCRQEWFSSPNDCVVCI